MNGKIVQTITTITKEFQWDAGHRVWGHEGKCKYIHGHRYKAEVTVTAPELDSLGRIIDFSVLKEKIGFWIERYWDHNLILHEDDPIRSLVTSTEMPGHVLGFQRPYIMPGRRNTTVEELAKELFYWSVRILLDTEIRVVHVKVWETPTSSADYWQEEVK